MSLSQMYLIYDKRHAGFIKLNGKFMAFFNSYNELLALIFPNFENSPCHSIVENEIFRISLPVFCRKHFNCGVIAAFNCSIAVGRMSSSPML